MHIFIDARGLENKIDGIGQFTIQILSRLHLYTADKFTVLILDNLGLSLPSSPNVSYIRTTVRRFTLAEGSRIQSIVNGQHPDLYLNMSPYIVGRITCPRYMMLYDLLATHFKGLFKGMGFYKEFLARRFFRFQTRRSIRSANGIITISHHSKEKICSYYNINKDFVGVVYGGVDIRCDPCADPQKISAFRNKYNLADKFILHVGNLKPYKNIINIIAAFNLFTIKHPDSSVQFVFTGNKGRGYAEAMAQIAKYNLSTKVKMLGYLDSSEIPLLYQASAGLFFPSLEEGQGLPVLEAMCCKTRVVTSRNTATEEIAEGHAFLVDSKNQTSLLEGLEYLAFTEKDEDKIQRAYLHARKFTWDRTVQDIMKIILMPAPSK